MSQPYPLAHAAQAIGQMLRFERPADATLSAYFRAHPKLGRNERAQIAETAFAAIRHYQKISSQIDKPAQQGHLVALTTRLLAEGISIKQLEAIASEAEIEHLKAFKAAKAAFSGNLNIEAELPVWLVDVLAQQAWSNEAILAFGRSVMQSAPLDLRVNTLKTKRKHILQELLAEGLHAEATPYSPWGIRLHDKAALMHHPRFLDGSIEVQDEGSQLLAELTQAKRGQMIVDFCAGAGGKTLAIGAMMANTGRLYAFDIAEKRLANLKPRMTRAGLTNITPQRIENEHDPRLARLNGKADCVLVDAPCSGLGTLRRNPDLKYRQSPERIAHLCQEQASILAAAAPLVRPNGTLIYATCSVLEVENSQQISHFLQNHPDWQLVSASERLQHSPPNQPSPYLQLNTQEHQTDGFFAAVLTRKQ